MPAFEAAQNIGEAICRDVRTELKQVFPYPFSYRK